LIGLDGQSAIIFGGNAYVTKKALEPEDSLYALNLNNYEWIKPTPSGQIPISRMYHKANVVGKFMVVSFGKYDILCIIVQIDYDFY